MRTSRGTFGLWLAAGCLMLGGCGGSNAPQPATGESGTPKLTADELGDMRERLERSLTHEAGTKTPMVAALSQLTPLPITAQMGVQQTAADALARIGVAAIPALLQALENDDPKVRARAASALARIGPEASAAVPALTRALSDVDVDVRRNAARALGQIGPAAEAAIPALSVVLAEPEESEKSPLPATAPAPQGGTRQPGPSPSDR